MIIQKEMSKLGVVILIAVLLLIMAANLFITRNWLGLAVFIFVLFLIFRKL